MTADELIGLSGPDGSGVGALTTTRGDLPLRRIQVRARVTGLTAGTRLTQVFGNPYDDPLEATYVFPLPDRAAVTSMQMEAQGRVVEGVLRERREAQDEYQRAMTAGRRAALAEEERPDVFTLHVGTILPGEEVTVRLTLAGVLPYEDGLVTYRFPLVVAPRYVPGVRNGPPDASRMDPPVLVPGSPNPVRLDVGVTFDPAGGVPQQLRSSLHRVRVAATDDGGLHVGLAPAERADRDLVLRWSPRKGSGEGGEPRTDKPRTEPLNPDEPRDPDEPDTALALAPDPDGAAGTFHLTLLPPNLSLTGRPRDVVLVLDRSGSMDGWKIVAARRAAARIVDSLDGRDRFAVLAFDTVVERPRGLDAGLAEASDHRRFLAVEFLARLEARGGTEMLDPLRDALALLGPPGEREPVLVLVTDGQVGNEDQILSELRPDAARVHVVGIDRAVNAGFLGRLAALGAGRCELVESEDRLDEAMHRIQQRVATPVLTEVRVVSAGLDIDSDSVWPGRRPALFAGAALHIAGRYRGRPESASPGSVVVTGRRQDGTTWRVEVPGSFTRNHAMTPVWARGRLRDLEDRHIAVPATSDERDALRRTVVETSLRYGVLCRFTGFVAVDSRTAAPGGEPLRMVQPVELPSGWALTAATSPMPGAGHVGGAGARPAMFGASAVPGGGDPAEEARDAVRLEMERLLRTGDAPLAEQWSALADLASRLRVLARQLSEPEARALVELADMLEQCDGPLGAPELVERLRNRAVRVLRDLPAATSGGGRRSARRRR